MHVEAIASICNSCKKALILISREWNVDVEEYIYCQGLVKWTIKFIASITNRRNILDLKIGLLLANT